MSSSTISIHGPYREAQQFLDLKLQLRDNGRVSCATVMSLHQLLDQWLTTIIKAGVTPRTFKDYETLLRRQIRSALGSRLIGTISQIDLQTLYSPATRIHAVNAKNTRNIKRSPRDMDAWGGKLSDGLKMRTIATTCFLQRVGNGSGAG